MMIRSDSGCGPPLPELHKRLRIAAAEEGIAYSDMAVKVIAKKLGVEIPAEYLNRRGRRPDTAAA